MRRVFLRSCVLFICLFSPPWAFAEGSVSIELLPAVAEYSRSADCSEIAPAAIFFADAQPGPSSRAPLEPLVPPDGLRTPLAQGEADLCFAYASAEAITQRTGIIISPLDIASTYYFSDVHDLAHLENPIVQRAIGPNISQFERKVIFDRRDTSILAPPKKAAHGYIDYLAGGDEASAILLANTKGLCQADDLLSDQGFQSHESVLNSLRETALGAHPDMFLPKNAVYSYDPAARFVNSSWMSYVNQKCRRVATQIPLLPVQFMAAKSIGGWRSLPEKAKRAATPMIYSRVDYALDHGRAPIIGMDWYIFEDPDGTDGDHAAAIVGRKKVNGVCHYLMRDNVNEPCENLHPKFAARCNNGHIWLTEEELGETMYSVTYLR